MRYLDNHLKFENDRKMTKITISSDFGRLPLRHRVHDGNFKYVFLYISMLSLNCEENINIIKIWDFSQNLRQNMDLIDPSPFNKAVVSKTDISRKITQIS